MRIFKELTIDFDTPKGFWARHFPVNRVRVRVKLTDIHGLTIGPVIDRDMCVGSRIQWTFPNEGAAQEEDID